MDNVIYEKLLELGDDMKIIKNDLENTKSDIKL
jgi:hypothetical protein